MNMSARRFWCLERQIARLMAERDLRAIGVNRATISAEAAEQTIERLTKEIGDTVEIQRAILVRPEPGAKERMMRIMGAG